MAGNREDHEEVDDVFVEVDSEPELEQLDTVKTVSESMQPEDIESFVDGWRHRVSVLFNRKRGPGGTFEQQSTRKRKSHVRNQGCSFFSFVLSSHDLY